MTQFCSLLCSAHRQQREEKLHSKSRLSSPKHPQVLLSLSTRVVKEKAFHGRELQEVTPFEVGPVVIALSMKRFFQSQLLDVMLEDLV
jgi:hypothetical protein